MIDKIKLTKTVSTQTGDKIDFTFNLTNYKTVRIYYSKSYKDYVVSLNLGKSKKFIITKSMWIIFNLYYQFIDKILRNGQ